MTERVILQPSGHWSDIILKHNDLPIKQMRRLRISPFQTPVFDFSQCMISVVRHNLIVSSIESLISGLLRGDKTFDLKNGGLSWHALGSGNPAWSSPPPSPSVSDTALVAEFYRKRVAISHKLYLTEKSSASTVTASNNYTILDNSLTETNETDLLGCNVLISDGDNAGEERIITGFFPGETPKRIAVSPRFTNPVLSGVSYTVFKRSSSITNQILCETPFYMGDCTGTIREQAIFGGTATSVTNSGIMCNVIRHDPIVKDEFTTIIRRIRFEFTMV